MGYTEAVVARRWNTSPVKTEQEAVKPSASACRHNKRSISAAARVPLAESEAAGNGETFAKIRVEKHSAKKVRMQ